MCLGVSRLFWRSDRRMPVLSDISLTIEQGMCLGLLGTSGAGKSTLGKVILGLEKPRQGQVLFQGQDLYGTVTQTRKSFRRDLQVVFQDCYSPVNPRMTAEQIIGEPLDNYESLSMSEQKRKIGELLEMVGLNPEDMRKYPHQFSGGQLQRINIARAIAVLEKRELVEMCDDKDRIFASSHPTVKSLISSILYEHPRHRSPSSGEVPTQHIG
jgi:nickel transport system ATP-binding protein